MSYSPYDPWIELWKHYEADGEPFIDLSSGSSFIPAPDVLKAQLVASIERDAYVPYAGPAGHPLSIGAIALYENLLIGDTDGRGEGRLTADEICMTSGATFALYAFLEHYKLTDRSPDVLLLGLNYYYFADCCRYLGLPVRELCSARPGAILPGVEELRAAFADRPPGLVVLVLPGNPSGELYDDAELTAMLELAREHDAWFLVDKLELDDISWDERFVNVARAAAAAGHLARTVIVGGTAKTRSLVATRTGFVVGPPMVVEHVKKLNHRFMFGPPSLEARFLLLDLFFRSLLFRERAEGPLSTARIGELAGAWREALVASCPSYRADVEAVLAGPAELALQLASYRGQLRARYAAIAGNRRAFFAALADVLEGFVEPRSGANFLVRFPGFTVGNQMERCKQVFAATRVALIPEACFRARRPDAGAGPAWTRISASLVTEPFAEGVERLRRYFAA